MIYGRDDVEVMLCGGGNFAVANPHDGRVYLVLPSDQFRSLPTAARAGGGRVFWLFCAPQPRGLQ